MTARPDIAGLQIRPIGAVTSGPASYGVATRGGRARVGRVWLSTPRNCDRDAGPSSRSWIDESLLTPI
jgi:hypothetical protein